MKSATLPNVSPKAVEPALEALRSHYHDLVEEYERLATSARAQLDHVSALLLPVPIAPVRSFDIGAIQPAKAKATSKATSKVVAEPVVEPLASAPTKTKAPGKTPKAPKAALKAPKAVAAITAPAKGKRVESALTAKEKAPKATAKGKGGRNGKLKMKDAYQGKTMLDAIGMVLQANSGKAVSADSVVSSLYGALSDDQYRVAKDRVTKSLSKGKIDDKWDRVPSQLGFYTLSVASLK